MAIESKKEIDEITVSGNDLVFYREVTTIADGVNEPTRQNYRTSIKRGDSLDDLPAKVAAVCRAVWV